jgi:hypothetical protein
MPRITTEIAPSELISAKTFKLLSRLGTFLRGTLLRTEKPVKDSKEELLTRRNVGRAWRGQ